MIQSTKPPPPPPTTTTTTTFIWMFSQTIYSSPSTSLLISQQPLIVWQVVLYKGGDLLLPFFLDTWFRLQNVSRKWQSSDEYGIVWHYLSTLTVTLSLNLRTSVLNTWRCRTIELLMQTLQEILFILMTVGWIIDHLYPLSNGIWKIMHDLKLLDSTLRLS